MPSINGGLSPDNASLAADRQNDSAALNDAIRAAADAAKEAGKDETIANSHFVGTTRASQRDASETGEATITLSEHERILKERVNEVQRERERERDDTYNREIALKQAQKLYTGRITAPETVVTAAGKLYEFLSATTEEAPQSAYDRGYEEGYERGHKHGEGASTAATYYASGHASGYLVGAEDRQLLVLKRVRELLLDEYRQHLRDERVTVGDAFDRVMSILNAPMEF